LDTTREGREDRNFLATQAQIIRSPIILRPALAQAPVTLPAGEDDAMAFVQEALTVTPVVNTHVVAIRFRHHDGDEAVRFVGAVIETYRQHLQSEETSSNTEVLALLTQREAELRSELSALEQRFVALRREHAVIGPGDEVLETYKSSISSLVQRLTELQANRIELEGQFEFVNAELEGNRSDLSSPPATEATPLENGSELFAEEDDPVEIRPFNSAGVRPATVRALAINGALSSGANSNYGDLSDIEDKLRVAVSRQEALSVQYGSRYPERRQNLAEIQQWQQVLQDSLDAMVKSLDHRRNMYERMEAELNRLYEDRVQQVKEIEDQLLEEQALEQEIGRTEKIYNVMFTRLTDMQLTDQALSEGRTSIIVRDLEDQDRRAERVWPQPAVFLAACAALGLLLGALYAVVMETREASRPS
jgi:uncharacterized protein involved in exopolysaccharide biosynthesis